MFGSDNKDDNQQANGFQPQFTPPNSDAATNDPIDDILANNAPADDSASTTTEPSTAPAPDTPIDSATPSPAAPTDLLGIKQQALQQLHPLVGHLDQSPDEKFRTLMMMIQASDDHSKLGEAFEAAKQITDDKARAQALLDVINEINYFTQQNKA